MAATMTTMESLAWLPGWKTGLLTCNPTAKKVSATTRKIRSAKQPNCLVFWCYRSDLFLRMKKHNRPGQDGLSNSMRLSRGYFQCATPLSLFVIVKHSRCLLADG